MPAFSCGNVYIQCGATLLLIGVLSFSSVFLLKNESGDIFLYFLDMDAYASIKGPDGKRQEEYPLFIPRWTLLSKKESPFKRHKESGQYHPKKFFQKLYILRDFSRYQRKNIYKNYVISIYYLYGFYPFGDANRKLKVHHIILKNPCLVVRLLYYKHPSCKASSQGSAVVPPPSGALWLDSLRGVLPLRPVPQNLPSP